MEKSRVTAVCSSVRAELMRPSRAAKITSPSRSRAADDTMEKSRVTAVCSSVRAELMRPSRAATITSPSRSRAAYDTMEKSRVTAVCSRKGHTAVQTSEATGGVPLYEPRPIHEPRRTPLEGPLDGTSNAVGRTSWGGHRIDETFPLD